MNKDGGLSDDVMQMSRWLFQNDNDGNNNDDNNENDYV